MYHSFFRFGRVVLDFMDSQPHPSGIDQLWQKSLLVEKLIDSQSNMTSLHKTTQKCMKTVANDVSQTHQLSGPVKQYLCGIQLI